MKSYLIVFLISMVPLIELRGAIPYAVGFGIPLVPAYIIAIIGNMLPVPFIYFFARKVLEWGKDKPVIGRFFTFCLEKGEKGGKALQAKAGRGLFVALLLFVGIPLPGMTNSILLLKFSTDAMAIAPNATWDSPSPIKENRFSTNVTPRREEQSAISTPTIKAYHTNGYWK